MSARNGGVINLMGRVDTGAPSDDVVDLKFPTSEELAVARRGYDRLKRRIGEANRAEDARLLEAELERLAAECNHE